MAHEVSTVSGKAEMFSGSGITPWHGLGQVVEGTLTAAEAIKAAGLDWEVEQRPVYWQNGGAHRVPNLVANVRQGADGRDVFLGTVAEKEYRILQNREAFDFMDSIIEDGRARFESAGALKNGSRVWMLARLPERIVKARGGDDPIAPYVCLANGHDGKMAIRLFLTHVRVVCNNTLTQALGSRNEAETLKVQHIGDVARKVEQAREILGLAERKADEEAAASSAMAAVPMGREQAAAYWSLIYPEPEKKAASAAHTLWQKRMDALDESFRNGEGATLAGETLWGAYNAVTAVEDHGGRFAGRTASSESRMAQVMFGNAADRKLSAHRAADQLVEVLLSREVRGEAGRELDSDPALRALLLSDCSSKAVRDGLHKVAVKN